MKKSLRQPYRQFFGTLANQCRIDIIEVLRKGPSNVTRICKEIRCKQSTVSHNLKRLEQCGFVFKKSEGKERIYRINEATIRPVLILMHAHMNKYCKKIVGHRHEA